MITIAVCDDNIQFAGLLADKIRDICAIKIPERYICRTLIIMDSPSTVPQKIKENNINIIFLDIDMPEISGFQLAEKINADSPDTIIIFVSSHENFVFSSFEYSPFRFLRKSKLSEELEDTLVKAVERYMSGSEVITIRTEGENIELRVKDILYIESDRNYYKVCGQSFEYRCRGTITQIEVAVKEFSFFRINSGCLVNMERIERFESPNRIITDAKTLYISQRRVSEFKAAYMSFARRRVT